VTGADLEVRRAQRLRTGELLRSGRTPLAVIAVAEHAASLADSAIAEALSRQPPAAPLACREGCAWCCHKVVGASAPEVFRIVAFLERNGTPLEELRQRLLRLEKERQTLAGDRWAAARLPCPLLVNDRCSVYSVRPLTCRGYNSTDARRCEQHVTSRTRVEIPLYAPQQRLGAVVLDGLLGGVNESGLHAEILNLGSALDIVLTDPEASAKWLRGEPVFARARLP
jgi:Fe-S-cluster containining protein